MKPTRKVAPKVVGEKPSVKKVPSPRTGKGGSEEIFFGETQCCAIFRSGAKKGTRCSNNAYYKQNSSCFCGVHSKKDQRTELKKNPNAAKRKAELLASREVLVEEAGERNREAGVKGNVICSKLRMMKDPDHIDGYRKVFPNFKHGNRKDGFGCARLSPKSLGPVKHGQPCLPDALNLENFHQGSKCFESELDKNGRPLKKFYVTQIEMFKDPVPHRHKEVAKDIKGNRNICSFWVWRLKNGEEKHLSYVDSRQFYCNFYERLVKKEAEYKKLVKMMDDGINIQIIGYDAYDVDAVPGKTFAQKLDRCYKDGTRPFGHELVLFSMLVLNPEDYPWRKYKTEDF